MPTFEAQYCEPQKLKTSSLLLTQPAAAALVAQDDDTLTGEQSTTLIQEMPGYSEPSKCVNPLRVRLDTTH